MKNRLSLLLLLALLSFTPVLAQRQTPAPTPQKQEPPPDDVLRVTTNLVQVDVVVLDKEGRQVTNLTPENFEISEDGKRQTITNFLYVTADAAAPSQPNPVAGTPPADKSVPSIPAPLRPEQVRRTIAFVVDDLGLSFESIGFVRQSLKKFVDEQMQPGDQVAIIRSSGNVGVLQQVTTNKQQLYNAIEQIRYYPLGRNGTSPFTDLNVGMQSWEARETGGREMQEFEEFRQDTFAVGTIGVLDYVLRGLGDLPGRKAVVLLSEGFRIHTNQGRSERILEAIKRLADQSNRASAVVYTIDARGLQPLGLTASDKPGINPYGGDAAKMPAIAGAGGQPVVASRTRAPEDSSRVSLSTNAQRAEVDSVAAFRQLDALMNQRNAQFFESQSVLSYLAQQTGGLYLRNQNNLAEGIQQLMEDQKGYYLVGYRPDDATIDPATGRRRFRKLSVKVKGAGLRVRARSGFYGITYEDARRKKGSRDEQLSSALVSPFSSGDVPLRLTSIFGDDPTTGAFMRSMLHVTARDLSFTKEADGSYKAVLDMVITVMGDNGGIVGQPLTNTQTIIANPNDYERIQRDGLVYILNVPVKQPGAYQLRVAVRDAKSEQVGAAGQYIEVPDLSRNRLALSGIVLLGTDPNAATTPASTSAGGAGAAQASNNQDLQSSPALRRLRQGMILSYGYTIYNAQIDGGTKRPQLQTQMRLFRDGQQVFTGKVLPFEIGQQTDTKRLNAGGRIRVGPDLVPGEYILQVVVTDLLVKDKTRPATVAQVIDFQVVK